MKIDFSKQGKHSKSVTINNKEYECLLVKTASNRSGQLKAEAVGDVVKIVVDNKEPMNTSLSKEIMSLLPEDRKLTALSKNYYVSNAYTFVRLYIRKDLERILALEEKQGGWIQKAQSNIVDDAMDKISPESDDSSIKQSTIGNINHNRKEISDSANKNSTSIQNDYNVKLRELIQKVNNTESNMSEYILNSNSTDMLIEVLKKGIDALLNKEQQTPIVSVPLEQPEPDSREIDNLRRQLRELANEKDNAIEQNAANEEKLRQLQEQLRRAKDDVIDVKEETVKALDLVIAELEKGCYQIDCENGEPKDDVYLVTQLKEIGEELQAVPDDNALQVRKALKDILRHHLKESDDVMNKLGSLMAYGMIPFMIEPREKGIFINPERIRAIYNKLELLLIPLGFQQILPQLFVETMNDGVENYEDVTGQQDAPVSVLEQLCPSLGQHKEKVDREQCMQVIKDIAHLGFMEDGEVIEKTKILL